ncbi:MAG TPA: zf-HC2 domain-containing protein, partial [Gemmataceae bacterium]|nr:zf-HC2 domain-containing protein [Gemmataceae bacterium]
MEPCQHVQDLLLDSLYGLLEAHEEEVVRAHVAVCPDCAAALAEARNQHDLLARAAQVISQVPVFVAPEDRPITFPAPQPEPEILPLPVARRRLPWKRWVGVCAAAALLLAAGIGWN